MSYKFDAEAEGRLNAYFDEIGALLGHPARRTSFATMALGLLSEAPRKSMEPVVARGRTAPNGTSADHQRIQHFITDAAWADAPVRLHAVKYALAELERHEPVDAWVIDDTGFVKKGSHSVGVQRQYCPPLGKVDNCQIGVSLTAASRSTHVPVDFALYLPCEWLEDPDKRREAKIPENVTFKTKIDLALDLMVKALENGIAGKVVLADSGYGYSRVFRDTVRTFGLDYAVGIHKDQSVWSLTCAERRKGAPSTVLEVAKALPEGAFRKYTWRQGTKSALSSRFAFCRVKAARTDEEEHSPQEPEWLVIEWPVGQREPTRYWLTTLRRRLTKKRIVRTIKERFRTEQMYEEMKGEIGLDHFEGRRYRGWNHHVTVALCCYAFVIAERLRHFPPSAGRTNQDGSLERAA